MLREEEELNHQLLEASDYFVTRRRYYQAAAVAIVIFVSGLLIVHTYKAPHYDLSNHFYQHLSPEIKQRSSLYNWSEVQDLTFSYTAEAPGMLRVKADNGEILYQCFAEEGIKQDIHIEVPVELKSLLLEQRSGSIRLRIDQSEVAVVNE